MIEVYYKDIENVIFFDEFILHFIFPCNENFEAYFSIDFK